MLNFAVGPVMSGETIRKIGAEQVPYFRTSEFSNVMFENESIIKELTGAERDARAVFLTGSGTASMEATVMNLFTSKDKVLVIDGGSFGHRFVELLDIYDIPHSIIVPEMGHGITEEQLCEFDGKGYTGFLVNLCETSIGVLYDLQLISEFCERNKLFLVVDAISSFLCDPFDMKKYGVNVMITGSQKALACPPGVSIVVLDQVALQRINQNTVKSMYLNLKLALDNGERGQTPFTPAVGILLQINQRLREIKVNGGAASECRKAAELASYFRGKIHEEQLPFGFFSTSPSNSVTPLTSLNGVSAHSIFEVLKNEYQIWVCPNGGKLKDKVFRVGHMGNLTTSDYDTLIRAFNDMKKRGRL